MPQARLSGLYWVSAQITVQNRYTSLWTNVGVELSPAANWALAVGNSAMLEPGAKDVKISATGMMQLRTNVRLMWRFVVHTPDMGSENGWIYITNMRLSAMYITN